MICTPVNWCAVTKGILTKHQIIKARLKYFLALIPIVTLICLFLLCWFTHRNIPHISSQDSSSYVYFHVTLSIVAFIFRVSPYCQTLVWFVLRGSLHTFLVNLYLKNISDNYHTSNVSLWCGFWYDFGQIAVENISGNIHSCMMCEVWCDSSKLDFLDSARFTFDRVKGQDEIQGPRLGGGGHPNMKVTGVWLQENESRGIRCRILYKKGGSFGVV